MDQELIDLMLAGDLCLHPTLDREVSTFNYADRPEFFDNPLFLKDADPSVLAEAGMSPADILRSATGVAADCMKLDGVGTLVAGAWADFVVVRADPLDDIRNLRQNEEVRIAGNAVPGGRFEGR